MVPDHPVFAPQPPTPYRNDPEYVAYLEQRIAALESGWPKTDLISPSFWRRAWAVYGHTLAVGLIFYAIAILIAVVLGGIAGVVD